MIYKNCLKCGNKVSKNCHLGYCTHCRDRSGVNNPLYGKHHSKESIEKIRQNHRGTGMLGHRHTVESKRKNAEWHKGKSNIGFLGRHHTEESRKKISQALWIEDRSLLKRQDSRENWFYEEWHKKVLLRDSFKCRISNPDCNGRIEVHHILNWKDYPELRYEINNGITLCHAHHPRGRAKEKRLEPIFQALVAVSKESPF